MTSAGWIQWKGGERPSGEIDVLWSNGAVSRNSFADKWGPTPHDSLDMWERGRSGYITAWRPSAT